jgi:hypothetical protein
MLLYTTREEPMIPIGLEARWVGHCGEEKNFAVLGIEPGPCNP